MYNTKAYKIWWILLLLSVWLIQAGSTLECYVYNCKAAVSTKCRIFPRWSADTRQCSGTCFMIRNATKNFVDVDRGCTGASTPGCRPSIYEIDLDIDEYSQYEACYCNTTLCNTGFSLRDQYSKTPAILLSLAILYIATFMQIQDSIMESQNGIFVSV